MQSEASKLNGILVEVWSEFGRAEEKFPPIRSTHEGYAILKEEVDELWENVKNNRDKEMLREEAIQVAAMAVRFIHDLL